jgi:hypothetical protein
MVESSGYMVFMLYVHMLEAANVMRPSSSMHVGQ